MAPATGNTRFKAQGAMNRSHGVIPISQPSGAEGVDGGGEVWNIQLPRTAVGVVGYLRC